CAKGRYGRSLLW
nr:immunoglobulin heavy chain junction region [Macaca mulatta]